MLRQLADGVRVPRVVHIDPQVTGDGDGGPLASCQGVYRRTRPRDDLAAGEDAVHGGGAAVPVEYQQAPLIQLRPRLRDEGHVGHLADGDDDRIPGNNLQLSLAESRRKTAAVVEDRLTFLELEALDPAVADDPAGALAADDLDALLAGVADLPVVGRHLIVRLQADHCDLTAGYSPGGAGHIDGHVAATDDDGLIANTRVATGVDVLQEGDRQQHAFKIDPRDGQGTAQGEADSDQHGVIFLCQLVKTYIHTDGDAGANLHTHAGDICKILVEDSLGKPVLQDTRTQEAAGLGLFLKDYGPDSQQRQVVGGGESGWARADNRDLPAGGIFDCRRRIGLLRRFGPVAGDTLEVADGDGLIHLAAAAAVFAGMSADAPDGLRQRIGLADDSEGPLEITLGDPLDISLGVGMDGAGDLTGRAQIIVPRNRARK